TNKLPSTIFAMTFASVTAKTGGVSRIMKSYSVFACSNTSFIRRDASNSDGLGGIGPQDKTSRKSTPEFSTACSNDDSPIRTLDKPVKVPRRNVQCIVGLRISASMCNVFFSCCAYTMARLAAVIDCPAPGPAEVTNTDDNASSTDEKCKFVRIVRYC